METEGRGGSIPAGFSTRYPLNFLRLRGKGDHACIELWGGCFRLFIQQRRKRVVVFGSKTKRGRKEDKEHRDMEHRQIQIHI